ncbi:MAG: hypothetical protein IT518_19850 [Burkholderiales bacterium]|nr:hypothetical protein [Burkholderiales bacterium]
MRTTLTIDDDLAGLLKQRARELGVPFKEAVNRTIRAGLGEAAIARRGKAPRTRPHSFGFRPGIDQDKLGQLADELEAEGYAASTGIGVDEILCVDRAGFNGYRMSKGRRFVQVP